MLGARTEGRHAAIVQELDVPVPFDLAHFVADLERQRRRPIHLRPFSSKPGTPCGLWIGTAETDYIYHEAGTTPFHATHIAVHELAHMLLGHQHTAAWEEFIGLLAPDVDPVLIQLILGRSAYGTAEEREAETLASLILSSAATSRLATMPPPYHPLSQPPRQCHPAGRPPSDIPHDRRTTDRSAHHDERSCLGANIVAGHSADVLPGNPVMAAPGTTLAGLDRADDDRRFHDDGGRVWVQTG
jgi:hypothetical protein